MEPTSRNWVCPTAIPLADGPGDSARSSIAPANGMTLRHLFGQLSGMRRPVSEGGSVTNSGHLMMDT